MTSLIEARLLRKSFGPVPALRGVSLDLQVGELVGLLGSNGAGKTTLIRCLASLVRPDGGQVLVNGEDLFGSSSARLRARLGLVGHQTLLYDSLTAEEKILRALLTLTRGIEFQAAEDSGVRDTGLGSAPASVPAVFPCAARPIRKRGPQHERRHKATRAK